MEFLAAEDFKTLSNPGVLSVQLLSPHNSASSRVTTTRVTVEAGGKQQVHPHPTSEQIRLALDGSGTLELGEGKRMSFGQGDVVRFVDGDLHGFENTGERPFTYLSVTSPPINSSYAYKSGT
jgi:quercetin dioxygenase-like cupin family protein